MGQDVGDIAIDDPEGFIETGGRGKSRLCAVGILVNPITNAISQPYPNANMTAIPNRNGTAVLSTVSQRRSLRMARSFAKSMFSPM